MVQSEIGSSNVTSEACSLIKEYIKSLEAQHDIEVLLASENGSRAWGYSSDSSDYDVKFIYRYNNPNRYKELYEPAQVIQFKSDCGMFDIHGWDIKKTLLLLRKGNAQVYEFTYSPVFYHKTTKAVGADYLIPFAREQSALNFEKIQRHYYALAKTTYFERIRDVGEPTLKKYFYILRPLLCVEFMENTGQLPLLEFQSLLEFSKNYLQMDEVYDITKDLLSLKRDGQIPNEVKKRIEVLDVWLGDKIQFWSDKLHSRKDQELTDLAIFDKMYRNIAFRQI